jgi:hypothetical protein
VAGTDVAAVGPDVAVAVVLGDRIGTGPVRDGVGAVPEHAAMRAASRTARAMNLARDGPIRTLRCWIVNFDPHGLARRPHGRWRPKTLERAAIRVIRQIAHTKARIRDCAQTRPPTLPSPGPAAQPAQASGSQTEPESPV